MKYQIANTFLLANLARCIQNGLEALFFGLQQRLHKVLVIWDFFAIDFLLSQRSNREVESAGSGLGS
jgi:hypothetical protein